MSCRGPRVRIPSPAYLWSQQEKNHEFLRFTFSQSKSDLNPKRNKTFSYNKNYKWRKKIAKFRVESSPCIGEDGTVYIGSSFDDGKGYLHAFGTVESNEPPETPTITGETNGKVGESYWYSITAVDFDRNPISFYIDWGDGDEGWTTERAFGEKC